MKIKEWLDKKRIKRSKKSVLPNIIINAYFDLDKKELEVDDFGSYIRLATYSKAARKYNLLPDLSIGIMRGEFEKIVNWYLGLKKERE